MAVIVDPLRQDRHGGGAEDICHGVPFSGCCSGQIGASDGWLQCGIVPTRRSVGTAYGFFDGRHYVTQQFALYATNACLEAKGIFTSGVPAISG